MGKKNGFFKRLRKRLSVFSTIITLIIHLSYIAYLAYSLNSDVGVRTVNIVLIAGTSVFLVAYLAMKIVGVGSIRATKRFYKRFKILTKLFSTFTAIYSLVTAATVSPFAMILPVIGAACLILRLIIDLIVSLIVGTTKRLAKSLKKRHERRKNRKEIEKMDIPTDDYCEIIDDVNDAVELTDLPVSNDETKEADAVTDAPCTSIAETE